MEHQLPEHGADPGIAVVWDAAIDPVATTPLWASVRLVTEPCPAPVPCSPAGEPTIVIEMTAAAPSPAPVGTLSR